MRPVRNCEHATVTERSKKSYLCFSCPKPLVFNLSHSTRRCVWVWNTLFLHGEDSALFLPTGRRKCLARFGAIFFFSRSQAPTKRASKRRRINSSVAPSIQRLCAHHDIIISWLWTIMSATMQTWVDVTTLRWLRSLRGEGGEPSGNQTEVVALHSPLDGIKCLPPPDTYTYTVITRPPFNPSHQLCPAELADSNCLLC